jgi:hypothetical protein
LLSAFGSRFSEHVPSNATLYTALAADPVHTLVHLPVAAIATFHRIGGRGQQRVVEKWQGFFQRRGDDRFSGRANPCEPVDPLPPLLQLAQGRLRTATPVKQRLDMLHDLAQFAPLRQATADVHEPLAFPWLQTTFAKQKPVLEQATDFLLTLLALAGHAAGHLVFGRRSTALQRGCGLAQAVALGGHGAADALGQLLEDMEGTNLLRHLAKDRAARRRSARRAIGRDPFEGHIARIQCLLQAPKKRFYIVMVRIVIQPLIQNPFLGPIVDGREHTGRPLIEFIGRHVA